MVSIYKTKTIKIDNESEVVEVELRGNSTSEKPTQIDSKDIRNGSVFIEIDTGKFYFFDSESKTWKEA